MPTRPKRASRSEKLHLRLTPSVRRRLQAAAKAQNKRVARISCFDSALSMADGMLPDRLTFRLNAKTMDGGSTRLSDAPPRSHERLRRPAQEPGVFD